MRQLKNFCNKSGDTPLDKDAVKDYVSKYDGYSEDQLIDELVKAVKKSKQSGTYSDEQMQSFVSMMSPQLAPEQRAKLSQMIELIKTDEI